MKTNKKKNISQASYIHLLLWKENNLFLLMLIKEFSDKKDWTS